MAVGERTQTRGGITVCGRRVAQMGDGIARQAVCPALEDDEFRPGGGEMRFDPPPSP
jgi:hypothetical protein